MTDGKRRGTKSSKKNDAKHSARKFERDAIRKAQGDRARQARDHAKISQIGMGRLVAKQFGLKAPQMYFRQEKGERGLSAAQRKFIAERTGVRLEWLTYGDEPMLPEGSVQTPPRPPRVIDDDGQVPTHGPIWDLLNDGRCNPLEPEDIRWLKHHLAFGDPAFGDPNTLESMELSLRLRRAWQMPSEETERAYLDASRRLRKDSGMRSYNHTGEQDGEHASDPGKHGAHTINKSVLQPPKTPQLPPGQPERRRKD
jgi:transcriptional regulator with XRE-family HTH domain